MKEIGIWRHKGWLAIAPMLGRLIPTYLLAGLLSLVVVTVVYADYIGPNRNYTTTACTMEWTGQVSGRECGFVNGSWKYVVNDTCNCNNAACITTLQNNYPDPSAACGPATNGNRVWGSSCVETEVCSQVTNTHPEATISNTITCSNPGAGGWCLTDPLVKFIVGEPISGEKITEVERNTGILCSVNAASGNCKYAHGLGDGVFNYKAWAHSTWGDTSVKTALSYKVDKTKPTLIESVPAPGGSNGWHVAAATLSVSGTDSTSGFNFGEIFVDGIWSLGPATINTDGVHSVQFRTFDIAGNANLSSLMTLRYDATPPSLAALLPGPDGANGWYVTPVALSVSGVDATSGFDRGEVSVDGSWGASPITVSIDGSHAIRFRTFDVAGNATTSASSTLNYDGTGPEIAPEIIGKNANGIYVAKLTFHVNATDAVSGIAQELIKIDQGGWRAPGSLTLPGGVHTIDFSAMDMAGNKTVASRKIRVDGTAPTATISAASDHCTNNEFLLSGTAEDDLQLASATLWIDGHGHPLDVDKKGNWSYSVSASRLGNGMHKAYVEVIDLVNLSSTTRVVRFEVDNTRPEVALEKTWYWQAGGHLRVSDSQTGIRGVDILLQDDDGLKDVFVYSGNDYPDKIYWASLIPSVLRPPGSRVKVSVTAFDNCGNWRTETAVMIVPVLPTATSTTVPLATQATPTNTIQVKPTSTPQKIVEVIRSKSKLQPEPPASGANQWQLEILVCLVIGFLLAILLQSYDPRPAAWNALADFRRESWGENWHSPDK